MAGALIDQGLVARLVVTQLATVSGLTVRALREPEPESDAYVVMRPLMLERRPRTRGASGEPDLADLQVRLEVVVGTSKANVYALDTAIQRVVEALDEQTLRDVPTSHQVDLYRVQGGDAEVDEERRLIAARLEIAGVVQRESGRTVSDFLS